MNNNLEDFIKQNRSDFDDDIPPASLWTRIEADVNKPAKRIALFAVLNRYRMVAASIIALVAVTVFVLYEHNKQVTERDASQAISPLPQPQMDNVDPKYAVTLNRFIEVVQTKQQELQASQKEHPRLYRSFAKDINELNANLKELQAQLKQSPDPDVILDAMIQNLQMQTDILNNQLQIIRKLKESKKTSNEKNTSTI